MKRLLKPLSHHVVGLAVAEDEDLTVAEDFAGGLVILPGGGERHFLGGVEGAAVGLYHLAVCTVDGEGRIEDITAEIIAAIDKTRG